MKNHPFKRLSCLFPICLLCVAMLMLTCCFSGTTFADSGPAAANSAAVTPNPDDVKASMDAMLDRLIAANPMRIIDSRTKEPIADFSTPNANATLDPGDKGNFRPLIYPIGVINTGMMLDSDVTGDPKYAAFTGKYFQFFSDGVAKTAKWPAKGNPFTLLTTPRALDNCGALGTALIKARHDKIGPDMKVFIDGMADWASNKQMRLDDRTFARTQPINASVWADDMYMSVPLLANMGWMTGQTKYYDDAVLQVTNMSKRLFIPAIGIYGHGWNSKNPDAKLISWGRANGWCMMAMAELLEVLPENHPGRAAVLAQFQAAAKGLAAYQDSSGLWRQVIDNKDSFLETSCSAMFTFAIARGVNEGWLDSATYSPVAKLGWAGLKTKISSTGHVDGTCAGTNYGGPLQMYLTKVPSDDIHGYGPALLAAGEIYKLATIEKTGKPWPVVDRAWPIKSDLGN